MRLLDNSNYRKILYSYIILGVIILFGSAIIIPEYMWGILAVVCIYSLYGIFCETRKFIKTASFVEEVDEILDGKQSVDLSRYTEGELSLLYNKVEKLVINLREKNEMLSKEKVLLVDSIADISHQMRTPLTSLNLILASMRKQDVSKNKIREYSRDMSLIMNRFDWLILTLLKIAKLDADTVKFNTEFVTFDSLINKITEVLAIPMELKEQELIKDVTGGFIGDLSWMTEAISNIVKNCHEHMQIGGKIYIKAKENPVYSEILIRDTGKGIDTKDIPHLFDRFYRGANTSENSVGIGLALAKMIITKHNGTIKVENHIEGGALFTIKIYKQNI